MNKIGNYRSQLENFVDNLEKKASFQKDASTTNRLFIKLNDFIGGSKLPDIIKKLDIRTLKLIHVILNERIINNNNPQTEKIKSLVEHRIAKLETHQAPSNISATSHKAATTWQKATTANIVLKNVKETTEPLQTKTKVISSTVPSIFKSIARFFKASKLTDEEFKKAQDSKGFEEKLESANISSGELKELISEGALLKTGKDKIVSKNGKQFLVSKELNENTRQKSIAIHAIATQAFAKGAFGEIKGSVSFGTETQVVAKLRLVNSDSSSMTEKARADVEKEYNILTKLKGEVGVQAAPYKVILDDSKQIIGYIGRRYTGDGSKLIKILNNETISSNRIAMINNLNVGLKNVWNNGFFQGDHKLANVLFLQESNKINPVIADLGGVIEKDKLAQNLKEYLKANKELDDLYDNNASNIQTANLEEKVSRLKGELYGANTPTTSNVEDYFSFYNFLKDAEKGKISEEACLDKIMNLMDKRIVFSQAVVSLALLCGKEEVELKDFFVVEGPGTEFKCKSIEEFKNKLEAQNLKTNLNEDQINGLFHALSNDSNARPSFDEFSNLWR